MTMGYLSTSGEIAVNVRRALVYKRELAPKGSAFYVASAKHMGYKYEMKFTVPTEGMTPDSERELKLAMADKLRMDIKK